MTKSDARRWVRQHNDDHVLDDDELVEAFTALHGRAPDDDDRADGLWSLCCASVY